MNGYDIELCNHQLRLLGIEKPQLVEPGGAGRRNGLSRAVVYKFFRGESVRNSTAARIIKKLKLKPENVVLAQGNGSKRKRSA